MSDPNTDCSPSWLMAFLAVIQLRPGMFLGDQSVKTLRTYIQAYTQARRDVGIPPFGADEESILPQFEAWLATRAKTEGRLTDLHWANHIEAIDDGPNNIMTFFRLFREFLAQQGRALDDPEAAWQTWPQDKSGFVL
jgi:hypothetical protein